MINSGIQNDTLRRQYKLRIPIFGKKSVEVTFPYEVVEREARRRNLTVQEFLEQYIAIAHYDNFNGVLYTFEKEKGNTDK